MTNLDPLAPGAYRYTRHRWACALCHAVRSGLPTYRADSLTPYLWCPCASDWQPHRLLTPYAAGLVAALRRATGKQPHARYRGGRQPFAGGVA